MDQLESRSGLELRIDGVAVLPTYAGYIDGGRGPAARARIIGKAASWYPWGPAVPNYLIEPAMLPGRHRCLPVWRLHALLISSWSRSGGHCGSHLTLVFFVDDALAEPVSCLVTRQLPHVDWEQLSEDFDF